jgi:AbrB family looped-hinge helix DNA binding protein
MSTSISVKVSKRFQIAVPRAARTQLNIQRGDRLLVDIQDGMLILLPQPQNYTSQLEGLHREIWEGVETEEYLDGERAAWDASQND